MSIESFWIVTSPGAESRIEDICFETNLRNLELQVKGGLSFDRSKGDLFPAVMFLRKEEAMVEATERLLAVKEALGKRRD